ncbi:S8 family peptidase [Streptomyces anulatus]|uniref:S8 family peptidase n=1 Tax=Streptomyces anulatus TaxID=1892 RepID=UPI00332A80C4
MNSSDQSDWGNSGLRIVEARENSKVVAFSDDPEMVEFKRRLDVYASGPQNGNVTATYESFFDKIIAVRPYGRQDRMGFELADKLHHLKAQDRLTVDVEVWHTGDQSAVDGWISVIGEALRAFGAVVHDSFSSASAGVAIMRVDAEREVVSQLLDVDLVAKVECLATNAGQVMTPSSFTADSLADAPGPTVEAPVVGVIDSGVQIEHPLLRGCVVEATTVSGSISDGIDRNGHGTAVASILLRGEFETQALTGDWEIPPCKIISVRVLDDDNRIPANRLPQSEITDAVQYLAGRGVRVINLSLGDVNGVMVGNRAPTIAAVLDELARKYGVVFVVPTGTVIPADYSGALDENFRVDYPSRMLESKTTGLMDPAPSAISLAVGGTVPPLKPAALGTAVVGKPGWPSPFSRVGPGINGAIKPELSAPAGTLGQSIDTGGLQNLDSFKVAVADGRAGSSGVVSYDVGTSLAVPHVTRACAAVQAEYPNASANLIRALVLQSAEERVSPFLDANDLTDGAKQGKSLRLTGYGEVSGHRSALSRDRETVLFAQQEIPVDSVHLYTIPIPDAFFVPGRVERGISVSLSYDPPVRARRMDYLGSRMQFDLLHGVSPEKTIDLLLAEEKEAKKARKLKGADGMLPKLSSLRTRERIDMKPSRTSRSFGVNQLGRYVRRSAFQLFNANAGQFVLAVQNVNRWDDAHGVQDYAVAIRLWVGDNLPPIYIDVRSKIRAMRAQATARAQVRG